MLQEVLTVVTPVFVIALIGYTWVKRDLPFDNNTVSTLVMMIGSPCLIYSSLTTNTPAFADLFLMVGAALLSIGGALLIAWIILKLLGWPIKTFMPSLVHANSGNMGLPLVLLAFGEEGLALGMAVFFVNSISQFTIGLSVSSGSFNPTQLLRQPVIWAVLLVLLVLGFELQPPRWFSETTKLLGGITIPAMLLMLGTSLARLNISSIKQTLTISVLRLSMGFGLALIAIEVFGLTGIAAGVILIQFAMPSAVFNYVFAERFNRDPDKVAAVILQSTLLSILTLPFLVAYALSRAGV
ncbi:MAG: AEC family transporter [Pseudomonadales bacterium]|nr:AEC family transporter [Pseudomonadales bacterium]